MVKYAFMIKLHNNDNVKVFNVLLYHSLFLCVEKHLK